MRWPDIPAHYLPTWIAITTPPGVLLLGLVGAASVMHRGLRSPGAVPGDPVARFGLLLVACLVLPVVAVIVVNANLYDDWRQVYFLYAPLCLPGSVRAALAGSGLPPAGAAAGRPRAGRSEPGRGGRRKRFPFIPISRSISTPWWTGRTPGSLGTQYDMALWGTIYREGLEHLLHRHPTASPQSLTIGGPKTSHSRRNRLLLPGAVRHRLSFVAKDKVGDFHLFDHPAYSRFGLPFAPRLHTRQLYHNTILTVTALNPARVDATTTAAYRAVAWAGPVSRPGLALYLDGRTLTGMKTACRPADRARHSFSAQVWLADIPDPPHQRPDIENLLFDFRWYGVQVDGRCLFRLSLPAHPLRAIKASGANLGQVVIPPSPHGVIVTDIVQAAYRAAVTAPPVARSHFALALNGTTLTYLRVPCRPADTEHSFFLEIMPRDPAVLAAAHRSRGFDRFSFSFWRPRPGTPQVDLRAAFAGTCLASIRLPAYPIAGLRTGQGRRAEPLWEVELTSPEQFRRVAAMARSRHEILMTMQS